MRIADFLDCDKEDFGKMGGRRRRKGFSGGSFSHSPWWVLSRCLSCFKPRSGELSNSRSKVVLAETGERRTKESGRREERKPIDGSFPLGCRTDGAKGESSSSLVEESTRSSEIVDSSVESSAIHVKELSFNLGLGVGLLFLIAESKNEFKKMMELRTQMELLLKENKDGMQRKDQYFVESEANNDFSYSSRDFNEVGTNYHLAIQNHLSSNHLVQTEITKDCIQLSKCDTQRKEGCPVAIDQLEAELETELERLQFSLCTQELSRNLQQEQGEMAVENDAQARSYFGEVYDCHDSDSIEDHGICPLELERRLHELLEARQKEQIAELEFALECSQNKLLEKEMEISWWKDTARVISQHVPETCLSRYRLQLPKALHLEKF
ncbi:protein POLAR LOCALIZATION DURING ASYMMETRIC DIVISION AND REDISTRIBUTION-like [Macadamia integrifolia]|uniref:protein POLAR LOCALIZATION DURING ASYMMETRIC DIVISION AND REDISTRIBUTION-like n=1 Tax=Macadamia integrifolia TaxID=60698 RepID=UPI001C50119D|nr:protein POLAR LOCALIZATION DURING ASYMMETRIC DIVISION AND REDISTRIBUTION-like [Macadamia integrifolia]